MLLHVYSNRFLCNHTGKVVPHVFPLCWKLSHFRPNPTWCISHRGLKTIWGNFQTAASDSYFWKKWNDWVSYKTITINLNRNHMAYPTLFHAVGTQCLVAVLLPRVCFFPVFFSGDSQFYEEDTLLWIGPCYNVRPLFCLNNVKKSRSLSLISLTDPLTNDRLRLFFGLAFILAHVKSL